MGEIGWLESVVARRSGSGWQGRCPAHEDRVASLSIGVGRDGRILLNCMAGCATRDILHALGIGWADLFEAELPTTSPFKPSPREPGGAQIIPLGREVTSYVYTDEWSRKLFEVVRFEPKTFRQRKPDGSWGLKGVRRVLYRLPRVLEKVACGETVWIVEGEKDADAIGGTTAPMGAGKWRSEYNEPLHHAHVAIIADRDWPGRVSARQIFLELREVASSVAVYESLAGKDFSDHLAAGFTVDQLRLRYRA